MLLYLNLAWDKRVLMVKDQRREVTPLDIEEAVFDGALLRLRPKVMTVGTIFAGLIPIMYGDATGSEIMQRIAAPMIGGMASATLLTLLVIPAIFVIWKRFALGRVNRQMLQPVRPFSHPQPAE
jgi:Cu(I)/Ag(I) efflux system membrane protein CusA/SilA